MYSGKVNIILNLLILLESFAFYESKGFILSSHVSLCVVPPSTIMLLLNANICTCMQYIIIEPFV